MDYNKRQNANDSMRMREWLKAKGVKAIPLHVAMWHIVFYRRTCEEYSGAYGEFDLKRQKKLERWLDKYPKIIKRVLRPFGIEAEFNQDARWYCVLLRKDGEEVVY